MAAPPRRKPMLTLASGGWVLLLMAVMLVVVVAGTLVPAVARWRNRPPGDGKDPATYAFDLEPCLVPRDQIVAGQLHRDLLRALVEPRVMRGADVEAFNREIRGKYVVPNDRVIGVVIGGEARAYPLSVLNLHEVANDTLGGEPILVTYSPLCDSAVVFSRAGIATTAPEFGVSGLLYNSNLLLYDRRPADRAQSDAATEARAGETGGESLWSQLLGRAVTGSRAGTALTVLPSSLTHWSNWLEAHPDTTVLAIDEGDLARYRQTSYLAYFETDRLLFAVDPPPPGSGPLVKARCIAVGAGAEPGALDAFSVFTFAEIAERSAGSSILDVRVGGALLRFRHELDPEAVTVMEVDASGAEHPIPCASGFWFAFHAMGFEPAAGAERAD